MNIKGSTFLSSIFVASLILNCVGIGVVVGMQINKPLAVSSVESDQPQTQQRPRLRRLLAEAIPADKRRLFRELRRDQRSVMRDKRQEIRRKRLALLEVLLAEPFILEEFDRALEATVTAQADLYRERNWPLAQLAKTLTLEERRHLAKTLRKELDR